MELKEAKRLADKYSRILEPFCTRQEIAGSIRRKKPDVKDIELVVIPWAYRLYEFLTFNYPRTWRFKKKGQKYQQIALPEGINLDLFVCTESTFAMNYLIRTGSAAWVHQFMKGIRVNGYYSKDAILREISMECCGDGENDTPVACQEEADVFKAVGIPWVDPERRV